MTEEQKIEELFEMTAGKGWQILIADLADRVEAIKDGLSRGEATPYQLGLAQGHIKVYREFIELRRMIEVALQQHKEDLADEAANV